MGPSVSSRFVSRSTLCSFVVIRTYIFLFNFSSSAFQFKLSSSSSCVDSVTVYGRGSGVWNMYTYTQAYVAGKMRIRSTFRKHIRIRYKYVYAMISWLHIRVVQSRRIRDLLNCTYMWKKCLRIRKYEENAYTTIVRFFLIYIYVKFNVKHIRNRGYAGVRTGVRTPKKMYT